MKRRVVSIFSGIDCMGLGVRKNFDVVAAVEIEKKACDTLNANKDLFHPNLKVFNRDVCSFSEKEILEFKGVEGIIGGPPCQSFSSARGAFDINDSRNNLIFEYLRWVRIIQPNFFLFENVEGLVQSNKVELFNQFLNEARNLNYTTYHKVLDAHDYGNAQSRKRVIVVGIRADLNINFEFPKPVEKKKFVRDILDTDIQGEYVEASQRIRELMPYIPEGGCWRDLKSEDLLRKALGISYDKRAGGMTGTCRRLHRDKPCPTLVTSPTRNTTLLYHPLENRPLSITEYKRAQGIPENYQIIGTLGQQYKFVGNGVPVEISYEISKAILNALDGK